MYTTEIAGVLVLILTSSIFTYCVCDGVHNFQTIDMGFHGLHVGKELRQQDFIVSNIRCLRERSRKIPHVICYQWPVFR